MKVVNRYLKFLTSICICAIACTGILSACSSGDLKSDDNSIVMIKNATMSTYGTGFAIGVDGKATDTIATAYSVVASANGATPKSAEVVLSGSEKRFSANIVFCDSVRNIAILKLSEAQNELKPSKIKMEVDYSDKVYVKGFDGTGNIMSDFENFNKSNIIRYNGNISDYDEQNTIKVYRYSNEFNRAAVGAPAVDSRGSIVGMCAYSLDSMNTFSQYILSSEELCKVLMSQNINFTTVEETKNKRIIVWAIILGVLLAALIIVYTTILTKKDESNLKYKDRYIKTKNGSLEGMIYKFEKNLTIGRDGTKCDIVYPIDESGVSGVHCTIKEIEGEIYLIDNFSTYGTFLENGTKLDPSTPYRIREKRFAFYLADSKNKFEFVNKKGKRK